MSFPVYRGADGRYAVAVDHVPDEAVALEPDLAAAQALAERLNADAAGPFFPSPLAGEGGARSASDEGCRRDA